MKHIIWVFWPAFIAAGIAETVFFTVIDPKQLYMLGQAVEISTTATYSIGFLMFWAICAGSSLMTWFMLPQEIKQALQNHSNQRADLSQPARGKP